MILLESASKQYPGAGAPVLRDIDFAVPRGGYASIMGASGSGKSTLMHVLGLLDTLSGGRYLLAGADTTGLTDAARATRRNRQIGFVFQDFRLLPQESVLQNVALPLLLQGVPARIREVKAKRLLRAVGLENDVYKYPRQLSGGMQQRAAIARAMVAAPSVLLADEPTGNLDPTAAREVLALLDALHRQGTTIVLITHDGAAAAHAQTRYFLESGSLKTDGGKL